MTTQNRTTSLPVSSTIRQRLVRRQHYFAACPSDRRPDSVTGVDIAPLEIPDAYVCTPKAYGDDRGTFLEWFRGDKLAAVTGRAFTPVQANHSISRRGVLRGHPLRRRAAGPGEIRLLLERRRARPDHRPAGRVAVVPQARRRAARRRRPARGLSRRGPRPRLPRAQRAGARDLPGLDAVQPRRSSTPCTRSTPSSALPWPAEVGEPVAVGQGRRRARASPPRSATGYFRRTTLVWPSTPTIDQPGVTRRPSATGDALPPAVTRSGGARVVHVPKCPPTQGVLA